MGNMQDLQDLVDPKPMMEVTTHRMSTYDQLIEILEYLNKTSSFLMKLIEVTDKNSVALCNYQKRIVNNQSSYRQAVQF